MSYASVPPPVSKTQQEAGIAAARDFERRFTGSWTKPYRVGRYIIIASKAPFYFSGWLPTLRWKSLSWGRYELKVVRL